MSLYSEVVEDHVARPRNPGALAEATHRGRADDEACGDVLVVHLVVADGAIARASFQASGCPPVLAAGSRLAERLPGCSVTDARALEPDELIADLGGLPKAKHHAARLAVAALRRALEQPLA